MPKIKIEIEVPNDKYCENRGDICPCCYYNSYGDYRCNLFDAELESDDKYHYYCIRCDKCKQAEVKQ